jgi:hypothetical protein
VEATPNEDRMLHDLDATVDAIAQWSPGDNAPLCEVLKLRQGDDRAYYESIFKASVDQLQNAVDQAKNATAAKWGGGDCDQKLQDAQDGLAKLGGLAKWGTSAALAHVDVALAEAEQAAAEVPELRAAVQAPLGAAQAYLEEASACVDHVVGRDRLILKLS